MPELNLTLITGRSTKQGAGISTGKEGADYLDATNVIELSPEDMRKSGLIDGAMVKVYSDFGAAEVRCRLTEIPEGLSFMAFGAACNQLVGGETYASGMPDSKHVTIKIIPVSP